MKDADCRGGSLDSWFSWSILYTSESAGIPGFPAALVESGLQQKAEESAQFKRENKPDRPRHTEHTQAFLDEG